MFRAYAALVALGLIWGSNFIYMKWATDLISPMQTVFLRVLFGFLPLAVIAWKTGVITRNQLRHLPHFLAMSVLATSFYYYGFVAGTALLPSSVAGLLSGAIPIFTFLSAAIFLREERPTRQMAVGVPLGFLGIVLSAQPWNGADGVNSLGVFWMLAGTLSVGASFVYARRFLSPLKLPPLALATWQTGLAVLTLALLTDFGRITAIATDANAMWGADHRPGCFGNWRRFPDLLLHHRQARAGSRRRGYLYCAGGRGHYWRGHRRRCDWYRNPCAGADPRGRGAYPDRKA